MSQDVRQSNLFAAEDFEKIYKSFKDVDFRAYDFDTLKQALIDYIKLYYPEDFNDYIESSEYIAMIELLAYLGTSLAFRMDLNTRENFMDTAERRESVIRLARMINYQPKRNIAANGVFKVIGVETTEPVTDSLGRNLSNLTIYWNDPNNPDSFDQFTTVQNAAFANTNPFGKPTKRGTVGNIPTDLYQYDNVKDLEVAYSVPIYVNNEQLPFEVVNVDFDDNESFYERHPDPANPFHVIYRNDGQGLQSANTGFFFYFRQGALFNVDNRFDFPIENRITPINITDINNSDVYVQEIDDLGNVQQKWTPVPAIVGNESVYFNPIDPDIRTIYGEITGQDDTVSLQFADGNFGDVPSGIFRTWVRSSANKVFSLRPDEAQNLEIIIPYIGADTQEYRLRLIFSLQETVSNSAPSETNEEIKVRAPQVYYTQDRMVNNEDYNVFPLSRGNEIAKLRSINRTHAGHSRYISINDPTGYHQNLILNSDDGALFKDKQIPFVEIEINNEVNEETSIVNTTLENFIRDRQLTNFFYDDYLLEFRRKKQVDWTLGDTYNQYNVFEFTYDTHTWDTVPSTVKDNTGQLKNVSTGDPFNYFSQSGAEDAYGAFRLLEEGAKIKFVSSADSLEFQWATVLAITSGTGSEFDGTLFTLDVPISNEWQISEIVPNFRRDFTQEEVDSISFELDKRNNFGLSYNVEVERFDGLGTKIGNGIWFIIESPDLTSVLNLTVPTQSWLLTATYKSTESTYLFQSRGTRYIFESYRDVRFFFDASQQKNFNVEALTADLDVIEIIDTNYSANSTETWKLVSNEWQSLTNQDILYPREYIGMKDRTVHNTVTETKATATLTDAANTTSTDTSTNISLGVLDMTPYVVAEGDTVEVRYFDNNQPMAMSAEWNLFNAVYEEDGYLNPAKVEVIPADTDRDGIPDEPLLFRRVVGTETLVFSERFTDIDGNETIRLWPALWVDLRAYSTTDYDLLPPPDNTPLFSYNDLVNEDLFLIKDTETAAYEFSVEYYVADSVLAGTSSETLTTDLVAISLNSTFIEKRDAVNGEIITTETSTFAPMVAFVIDEVAVAELQVIRATNIVDFDDPVERHNYIVTELQSGILPLPIVFDPDTNHFVNNGRSFTLDANANDKDTFDYKWTHFAPADHRIDPSISNIIDMLILTDTYYRDVITWKDSGEPASQFPTAPTTENLRVQFGELNDFKMMSDQIVFGPANFKLLFGSQAEPELQVTFKVVKVPTTLLTDNEVKSKVITAIDEFFAIENWDFGETYYFTEMAAYVHTKLAGAIGSIVLVPSYRESQFGNLFEVKSESNELFLSTATVANVEIVNNLTETNMRL